MRLTDVQIMNFKGLDDIQLQFRPGFNLIKGENGKGKTSILEAISVGLGGFLIGIEGVRSRHITKEEIKRVYNPMGDGSCDCMFSVPVEIALTAEFDDGDVISWTRGRNSVNASRSTLQPRDISKKAEKLANDEKAMLPIVNYQAAGRVWSQKREKSENVFRTKYIRTVGYLDSLAEASNIKLLLNWCIKMEQVSWQKNMRIAEYEAVKNIVAAFMIEMGHHYNCKVFYDKQFEELMYSENGKILPIRDLSAGFQSLIWMVFDIAYRMAVLNPNKGNDIALTNGVVLIDELDMHLHPKWQWKVIDALRKVFPNIQFIATTHSPILFASAKSVWIIDIEKEQPTYDNSSYGLDLNTSIRRYQETFDVPEKVQQLIDKFYDALNDCSYDLAKELLLELEKIIEPSNPGLARLKTCLELETILLED